MKKNVTAIGLSVCLAAALAVSAGALTSFRGDPVVTDAVAEYSVRQSLGQTEFVADVSSDRDFELSDHVTVTYANGETEKMFLSEGIDGTYTYAIDAEEASYTVTPPAIFFHDEISTVAIDDLAVGTDVQIHGKEWFKITDIEETTAMGCPALAVSVEATGDGRVMPRIPKLVIGGEEYGSVSTIVFDDNENFESGMFVFVLADGVSWTNGEIVIDNVLNRNVNEPSAIAVAPALNEIAVTESVTAYQN